MSSYLIVVARTQTQEGVLEFRHGETHVKSRCWWDLQ